MRRVRPRRQCVPGAAICALTCQSTRTHNSRRRLRRRCWWSGHFYVIRRIKALEFGHLMHRTPRHQERRLPAPSASSSGRQESVASKPSETCCGCPVHGRHLLGDFCLCLRRRKISSKPGGQHVNAVRRHSDSDSFRSMGVARILEGSQALAMKRVEP